MKLFTLPNGTHRIGVWVFVAGTKKSWVGFKWYRVEIGPPTETGLSVEWSVNGSNVSLDTAFIDCEFNAIDSSFHFTSYNYDKFWSVTVSADPISGTGSYPCYGAYNFTQSPNEGYVTQGSNTGGLQLKELTPHLASGTFSFDAVYWHFQSGGTVEYDESKKVQIAGHFRWRRTK